MKLSSILTYTLCSIIFKPKGWCMKSKTRLDIDKEFLNGTNNEHFFEGFINLLEAIQGAGPLLFSLPTPTLYQLLSYRG